MSAATVAELQRELLALVKGRSYFSTWAMVNGLPLNEHVSLRQGISTAAKVRELRLKIHALNPSAALYFCWHGGELAQQEFASLVKRAEAARSGT